MAGSKFAPDNIGFDSLLAQIEDISVGPDGFEYASVVTQFGESRNILMVVQRAKGIKPKVGERWIIDKSFGYWTFAAVCVTKDKALEKFVATSPLTTVTGPWHVTHGLGTPDVAVTLRVTATGVVEAPVALTITDENSLTLTITGAHPAGHYTLVVIG
jgi:hypothetical protein